MACTGLIPCSEFSIYYTNVPSHCDRTDDCMWSGDQCVPDQGTGHDCSDYAASSEPDGCTSPNIC